MKKLIMSEYDPLKIIQFLCETFFNIIKNNI